MWVFAPPVSSIFSKLFFNSLYSCDEEDEDDNYLVSKPGSDVMEEEKSIKENGKYNEQ